jgi:hypothetical protein
MCALWEEEISDPGKEDGSVCVTLHLLVNTDLFIRDARQCQIGIVHFSVDHGPTPEKGTPAAIQPMNVMGFLLRGTKPSTRASGEELATDHTCSCGSVDS